MGLSDSSSRRRCADRKQAHARRKFGCGPRPVPIGIILLRARAGVRGFNRAHEAEPRQVPPAH
jgi:hypothetical protein